MDDFIGVTTAGFVLGLLLAFLIAVPIAYSVGVADMRKEAINRGLAGYCPISGNWEFNGECK